MGQLGPVDDATLAAMPEKTKKHPAVVELYRQHDYLTAYAMHTDLRVLEGGPAAAVGAAHDWERHGLLQSEFLIRNGLQPHHQLLEIGCGTGRLARKLVPYLEPDHYTGVDISPAARNAAEEIAEAEGWIWKCPRFLESIIPSDRQFRMAWAFSVFSHLPREVVQLTMCQVQAVLAPGGRFFFSYVPEAKNERTGLKQFRHTIEVYELACMSAALDFYPAGKWLPKHAWTGEQRIGLAVRR